MDCILVFFINSIILNSCTIIWWVWNLVKTNFAAATAMRRFGAKGCTPFPFSLTRVLLFLYFPLFGEVMIITLPLYCIPTGSAVRFADLSLKSICSHHLFNKTNRMLLFLHLCDPGSFFDLSLFRAFTAMLIDLFDRFHRIPPLKMTITIFLR